MSGERSGIRWDFGPDPKAKEHLLETAVDPVQTAAAVSEFERIVDPRAVAVEAKRELDRLRLLEAEAKESVVLAKMAADAASFQVQEALKVYDKAVYAMTVFL